MGARSRRVSFRPPDEVALTPAQRSCAWFFFVMALLFLLQALLGGATQHYRAEIANFFGFDLARCLPFNIARTWHLQLAIFWVATSFLAAGIFLAPMIAGREPRAAELACLTDCWARWRSWCSAAWPASMRASRDGSSAVVLVWRSGIRVSGSRPFLANPADRRPVLLGGHSVSRTSRTAAARNTWAICRGCSSSRRFPFRRFTPWACWRGPTSHFTTTDFWRFWVVHLWVEDFLELFTTIMVAYIFVLLGVVHERVALRVIYLDILLYSAGGVVGTMHHVYFSGEPALHMALGAFFSAAEVIPLTFLTLEAWSFLQLGAQQEAKSRTPFPHFWAVMFLAAVGFWNFLGAGIFGFLINLPIVSYYEIGTALTANHGHAAMMGVYGMLAVGLALVLPALHRSRKALVRPRREDQLLVAQSRAGVDGVRHAVPAGHLAALSFRERGILRRANAEVHFEPHECTARVAASAGRHSCSFSAARCRALPCLAGDALDEAIDLGRRTA